MKSIFLIMIGIVTANTVWCQSAQVQSPSRLSENEIAEVKRITACPVDVNYFQVENRCW